MLQVVNIVIKFALKVTDDTDVWSNPSALRSDRQRQFVDTKFGRLVIFTTKVSFHILYEKNVRLLRFIKLQRRQITLWKLSSELSSFNDIMKSIFIYGKIFQFPLKSNILSKRQLDFVLERSVITNLLECVYNFTLSHLIMYQPH